jgi:uncharacterized Rossmann fold enzyme
VITVEGTGQRERERMKRSDREYVIIVEAKATVNCKKRTIRPQMIVTENKNEEKRAKSAAREEGCLTTERC